MLDKLQHIAGRYEELNRKLADPEVNQNQQLLRDLGKEHAELEPVIGVYNKYTKLLTEIEGHEEILSDPTDPELAQLAQEELSELRAQKDLLADELKFMLLPKDPDDNKNALLEIRAGTGGDEASLFAGDLLRMYSQYAEKMGLKVELMSLSEGSKGGYKEVIALVSGSQAFGILKYESGVHRVQRVPSTESQGRIHTSAVTVAVMPEAQEVELEIKSTEIRVDVYRSSGPGGQSVNTTDSAVRITHIPTGLVVTIQDEKSQHKNRAKAMRVLRSRLLDKITSEEHAKRSEARRTMVKSGDRSEKIRTYNFPQDRLTDHRINLTVHNLPQILSGGIDDVVTQLRTHFQAEQLQSAGT
jgi:peptide chain release factor 1